MVHILVATQYNPYQWFSGYYANLLSEPLDQCIQKLNDTIRSQADKNGYQVVDVYTAFHNSKTRLCNATDSPLELDFHPNAQGHKMISDTFQPVVKELSFTRPADAEPHCFVDCHRCRCPYPDPAGSSFPSETETLVVTV